MLHMGHIKLLEFARSLSLDSYVLVLIDSDSRIKELKGQNRPIYLQDERLYILSSLKYVNKVDIFYTDQELISKIKDYKPDIMVKGSDYLDKEIIGKEHCKEIIFYERIQNYSTTQKIKSITNR